MFMTIYPYQLTPSINQNLAQHLPYHNFLANVEIDFAGDQNRDGGYLRFSMSCLNRSTRKLTWLLRSMRRIEESRDEGGEVVTSLADPSANIIFGAVVDDRYTGEIHVTIIATGFSQSFQKTLLTDPKAARLVDKVATSREIREIPVSPKSSSATPSRPATRKLFF